MSLLLNNESKMRTYIKKLGSRVEINRKKAIFRLICFKPLFLREHCLRKGLFYISKNRIFICSKKEYEDILLELLNKKGLTKRIKEFSINEDGFQYISLKEKKLKYFKNEEMSEIHSTNEYQNLPDPKYNIFILQFEKEDLEDSSDPLDEETEDGNITSIHNLNSFNFKIMNKKLQYDNFKNKLNSKQAKDKSFIIKRGKTLNNTKKIGDILSELDNRLIKKLPVQQKEISKVNVSKSEKLKRVELWKKSLFLKKRGKSYSTEKSSTMINDILLNKIQKRGKGDFQRAVKIFYKKRFLFEQYDRARSFDLQVTNMQRFNQMI